MTSILDRSPLLVFCLLGLGAYAVERGLAETDDPGQRVIAVTDEQVDALRARWDAQWSRPPTGRELRGLIDEAVREEILYREALRLGLERGDPIVRRRLAQKMTFMLEDNTELPALADREVDEYFAAQAGRYREPVRTTFRHVFLDERRADPRGDAAALLHEIRNAEEGRWRGAGDPFPLLREYAERTEREIAELFGAAFAAAVGDLAAGGWHGPVDSAHGTHLVRVLGRSAPPVPTLDDVRERVVQDLLAARRRAQNAAALRTLRNRYEVRLPGPERIGERE